MSPNTHHLMIDPITFKAAKEMMDQKFERIIGYYLEDAILYIDTIKDGLQKQDAEQISAAAHTIKSSSRQIGAFAMANKAANIELAAKEFIQHKEEFDKINQQCLYLEEMFQATSMEIKKQMQ